MLGLLLVPSLLAAPPGDSASWEALSEKPVHVECAEVSGEPWCRSFGIIEAPLAKVSGALRDMRNNADAFDSVVRIDVISDDVLLVVLDYPAPLDDREYAAKYSFSTDGDVHLYTWTPARGVPESGEAVRLPRFAGEWRLEPRGDDTWVRYTWQAEIAGSFPRLGYSTAWKRAGYEALRDLAHTQGAALRADR